MTMNTRIFEEKKKVLSKNILVVTSLQTVRPGEDPQYTCLAWRGRGSVCIPVIGSRRRRGGSSKARDGGGFDSSVQEVEQPNEKLSGKHTSR